MKVVKVYGALKKRLGGQGRFEFVANTPAEAMRALCANFPGLDKWLIDSEQNGIYYKVAVGKEKITEDKLEDLQLPVLALQSFLVDVTCTASARARRRSSTSLARRRRRGTSPTCPPTRATTSAPRTPRGSTC